MKILANFKKMLGLGVAFSVCIVMIPVGIVEKFQELLYFI